jgi:hypothetical protein
MPSRAVADAETGKLVTISLWETREQMEAAGRGTAAGIHDQAAAATGLTAPSLETYEVTMRG